MPSKSLRQFFEDNVGAEFRAFHWSEEEINALFGAFILGAQTALQYSEENPEEVQQEIDEFLSNNTGENVH